MGVIDVSTFNSPQIIEYREGVGTQLVAATRKDQPRWASDKASDNYRHAGNDKYGDEELVYMAAWGIHGGLVVLNSSVTPASPTLQCKTPSTGIPAVSLAMSNRVKLREYFAFVPLEQYVGGFAVIDISNAAYTNTNESSKEQEPSKEPSMEPSMEPSVNLIVTVHVPLSEFNNSDNDDGSPVPTTKAYCLAVSESWHVYLFIAETAAVYIYSLDDIFKSKVKAKG